MVTSVENVRTNRPAPATRANDKATCATTSAFEAEPAIARDAATVLLQRVVRLDAAEPERRRQTEQQRRTERHSGGESQHAPVERQIQGDGADLGSELANQQCGAELGERKPRDATGDGQQQTFSSSWQARRVRDAPSARRMLIS